MGERVKQRYVPSVQLLNPGLNNINAGYIKGGSKGKGEGTGLRYQV